MSKKPKKNQSKKKPIRYPQPKPETPTRDWTQPTPHSVQLDLARWNHWWAKLNGGDTISTLAAWAKLLHVPRAGKAA